MNEIRLVADSTIDLTKELVEELKVTVVPLSLSFEDDPSKMYRDGIDIVTNDIIDHVSKTGKLPQTSCASPLTYEEIFNKIIDEGDSVICTGIGSLLSANFQSVMLAKESCKDPSKVTVIDSANLSSASGLLLLRIRNLIKEGKTREEIKKICEEDIIPHTSASFTIATSDYMVKGGRCSAFVGFVVKLFGIKPVLKVIEGKLLLIRKVVGSINQAILSIYQEMFKNIENVDKKYLMITHFASDEAVKYIKEIIEKNCHFEHVYETHAGCIISSHCGPGTIGLIYNCKPNK